MKNEDLYVYKKSDFYEDYIDSQKEYYERANADAYFAERLAEKDREIALLKERICNGDVSRLTWIDDCIAKDKEIAELKKEVSRQKRLRCYNLKMWCSAERFTNRGRTIPEEGRWWERHFFSVCRIWEKFREAK